MIQTEKIRLLAKQAMYLVSAHTALYMLCNYAHGKTDMLYVVKEYMPILLLFSFIPLAAVFMLFTQSAREE
jgi:hypothetical protein